MLVQCALYSRLGLTHLSGVYCDLLLDCYHNNCPIDERVRATARIGFSVSSDELIFCFLLRCREAMNNGRYDDALQIFEAVDPLIQRILRYQQYIFLCIGLVKLKRAIRR